MSWQDGLPKNIRIGPFDVPVILDQDEQLKSEDAWGSYMHGTGIAIRTDHPGGPFVVDTMLHEVTHGIYKTSALLPGDKEERVTLVMATGLTQVFRDNPQLLKWIGAQLGE